LFSPELVWPPAIAVELATRRAAYAHAYRGQTRFEIPLGFELANIILTLTTFAEETPQTTNRDHAYYQEVQAQFGPHASHPLIQSLNAMPLTMMDQYSFRNNGCGYHMVGGVLGRRDLYFQGSGGSVLWSTDAFTPRMPMLRDFVVVSGFADFASEHADYYRELEAKYAATVPTDHMESWLEARFPGITYAGSTVIFSPLVGGNHNTSRVSFDGYEETLMFVSGPDGTPLDAKDGGGYARVLFTEIDHNFVNPISNNHLDAIQAALADLGAWKTQDGYVSPYQTFNEYMTWGVFDLWWRDWCVETKCEDEVLEAVRSRSVADIMDRRGFPRYRAFRDQLEELYANRAEGAEIPDLYPAILDWMSTAP
jgi:hypothetical protein